jgi:hypothetical protein
LFEEAVAKLWHDGLIRRGIVSACMMLMLHLSAIRAYSQGTRLPFLHGPAGS